MNFYIVLAISVFAGGSKASGCPIEVTAKEPNYGSEGKFGEVHVLSFSRTSGSTSCLWRFSSGKKNLLNLLFINITAQTKSSGSGCNGNYALIKTHDAERLSSTTFDPYCGERSLPGIRINGTIEIELHDRGSRSVDRGISLAVFVESSSKHCGGIYNDSSYGVPVSYDSSLVPRNEITHCVWFFEFHQARSLSVIASYFGLEQDLVTGVPKCSRNKQYLSMRSWNRTNWDSYQEIRECKAQSKQTPIFNLPKTDRFAVTVHSEHWFSSKKLHAVCFPLTEGFSDSKLAINGKGNKTYHDVLLDDPNVVEGLLVLKPKEDNDQLFFAMNHGRQFCNGGTLKIWSEHGNTFHRNSSLCSSPNSDLYSVFNFQDTALLYFKSTVSQLKELKIWFYSSNKGCGGLFPFLPGHTIIVKSPNYGNGNYPADSDCRWVFLADSTTRIGIAIKTMNLESCSFDYVDIYQGFRKQQAKLGQICKRQTRNYIATGDMEIYFKSDGGLEYAGFMINVTEAFDHCRSSPCSHGNCVVSASSFKCNCHSGYTGNQCETDINECDNNPCQNGGSCRNTAGYYHCTCKADYSGTNCQTCGGTHLLSNGNSSMIASPNFGTGKYPAHLDCQWNFIVSNSTILVIAINEIKLEDSDTNCQYDYISIYKGVYSAKVRQHKICSKPKMYLQNGNVTIKFKSDGSGQGTGFRMDVFAVEDRKYKSCTEALIANGNIGGRYFLQIDFGTVFVLCELQGNKIKTMVTHGDGDKRFHVSGYDKNGSFKKTLVYMQNLTGITKIIDRSDTCMQAVNVTCHFSRITSFSWLTNRNNQRMRYWAGGPSNGTGCACGRTESCASKFIKCNCDENDQVLRYDMGLVTKKGDLPLISIHTGDTKGYYAYKDITVGNVVCFNAIPQTTAAAITTSKRTTVTIQSTTTSKTGTKTDPNRTPKDSTSNAITTSKRTTVTTQSTTTSKTGTKTDPKITSKDSTSKKYPAGITTPTDKATKSGDSKYATATTKITIIGKKGQSSSGNITVYAVSAVSGIIAVIFIVAVIIIIRRRQARSTLKDSDETSSRKERPRQNSAMPLVEMTERPKPFVPDASVTYSVPDNCHQETEVTEWNNPYYESNDTAPPTMEAENLYYGSNVGMTMENPYYESSDQVHTEAEYETTCPDEHLYAAPDANPSKPVYSYATTEELKSGVTGNCEENIYEYADAEQVL